MLVNIDFFEEIYVFKLIKKLEVIIDNNSDCLMSLRSDSKKASMRDELKRLVTDFNEQLKPYVFISPDNSRDNITIKSD